MTRQIPFSFPPPDDYRFESFYDEPNKELLHQLRAGPWGEDGLHLYLWGPNGSGKTHLLQAACRAAGERGSEAAYLPLGDHIELQPAWLEGLECSRLVCIDDVQAVAGRPDWEEAVFDLLNRVRDTSGSMLVAASAPAPAIAFGLADLCTRLSWGLTYPVHALNDEQKLHILQARAVSRGLELPEETGRYLLRRMPRDLRSLLHILDRLDTESLAAMRRLTVPFVKEVLQSSTPRDIETMG